MKLLVFAHRLELGGTQTNAIELAAALRDLHGFDIVFHATPGAMTPFLEEKGLRLFPAPDARFHPSYSRMRALREIIRDEKPDLIHAWDWWQAMEAYLGAYLPLKLPLLISDMMMNLTRVLPRAVPTTFGFRGLQEEATRKGWQKALLLPPPVDVKTNTPELPYNTTALERLGLKPQNIALVTVSRLSHVMKSESIFQTIQAVKNIGNDVPVQFVIVGDGAARHEIEEKAQTVNTMLGRNAIILTGPFTDPRPAYAAADIVIGMGGSALRGMAFGKPVIVTGEKGFAQVFCSRTVDTFETNGLYGFGSGDSDGETYRLERILRRLSRDALLRGFAGAFGQDYVTKNHSLEKLSGDLAGYCREAVKAKRAMPLADATRSSYYYMRDRRFKTASRDRIIDDVSGCDTAKALSRRAASHSESTERT